jgi:hypothetical protein
MFDSLTRCMHCHYHELGEYNFHVAKYLPLGISSTNTIVNLDETIDLLLYWPSAFQVKLPTVENNPCEPKCIYN